MPWPMVPLGRVAQVERTGVDPALVDRGTPYVGLENIERGGRLVNVSATGPGELASTKFRFSGHHVLFGKLRPNLAKVARPQFSGICSTDILPICPGQTLDGRYLARWLLTPDTVALAASRATGANLPRLSPTELLRFELPLPPIDEQRRIAEILDRADALRAKRREALAFLEDLAQSIFLDMFGEADLAWPALTVGELADQANGGIRTGPFGSQLLHSEFVESGIAVLGIDNAVHNEFRWGAERFISDRKYGQLRRYTVHPGDVVITIMGTCGRAAIVPDDVPTAISTKHLCCVTLDQKRALPVYVHAYFLRHPDALTYLRQTAKGAIMSGLNMGIIKAMPIAVPPLSAQREFAVRIGQIHGTRAAVRSAGKQADALFASLQQRAFAGLL